MNGLVTDDVGVCRGRPDRHVAKTREAEGRSINLIAPSVEHAKEECKAHSSSEASSSFEGCRGTTTGSIPDSVGKQTVSVPADSSMTGSTRTILGSSRAVFGRTGEG